MKNPAPEPRPDRLLRTACDVIVDRGLANTRTVDVARAAGVSQSLVFYHFATKEELLVKAFEYAAGQELAVLDALLSSSVAPLDKLRKLLRWYAPGSRSRSWALWIDGWSESLRTPELARICRRVDGRRREALTEIIEAGAAEAAFACDDPAAAAWRIGALVDGLAVQAATQHRVVTLRYLADLARTGVARELGVAVERLA
ncbi:MAG TPA: TetR/AcrR family transcriptional regulator [Pilimelia sp.]|nr:TetR/AcrR family transcriptional regulator [Pilimelia sp.]